ncbi:MAG: hypothetical protein HRU11_11385 [Parvularculaceae bacterium]|nr:hypothetical protein [Parvularculaceae bacterium]
MRSATNVIEGRERDRETPLAGLKAETSRGPQPQAAHLASLRPEGRYSVFYKAQLRVAVMDDYASFSGGVHKYADHVVSTLLSTHAKDPIEGFQEAWVQSPDEASHPFHGRNLRNFLGGKDSAHAVWAVLDLYIKLRSPVLAGGFKLDGYLERLGLTVSEFAGARPQTGSLSEGLYELSGTNDGIREYVLVQPLERRAFGLVKFIRQHVTGGDPHADPEPHGLTDQRTAFGPGIVVPGDSCATLLAKDPDTDELILGKLNVDASTLTVLTEEGAQAKTLTRGNSADLPSHIVNTSLGDNA